MRPVTLGLVTLLHGTSSLALSGCAGSTDRHRTADDHTLVNTAVHGALAGRPTLELPTPIPGHSTCLIPFSLEDRKGWFDRTDPFSSGGFAARASLSSSSTAFSTYAPAWGGAVRWHNAIIHDLSTREEWPILDRRGVIARWAAFAPPPEPISSTKGAVCIAMVFLATTADTNKDGQLNDLDANTAIVTAGDGRNPRPVTPPDAQIWSTSFDAAHNRIYFLIVSDTNRDGKFTPEDAPVPYQLEVAAGGVASPILNEQTLRAVEGLLK